DEELLADRKHQRERVEDRRADRRAAMPVGCGNGLDIEAPVAWLNLESIRFCRDLRHESRTPADVSTGIRYARRRPRPGGSIRPNGGSIRPAKIYPRPTVTELSS